MPLDDLIFRPRTPAASNPLLSAALGGLLLLSTSCSPDDEGVTTDAGVSADAGGGSDAGGSSDAGETIDASEIADAGVTVDAGDSTDGGAAFDASATFDAAADVDASELMDASAITDARGCDADRVRVITAADASPGMTLEAFTAMCDGLGGYIEIHPHCGGMNSCAGLSYDSDTGILTEHTCAGLNTCTGYSCVIP